MKLQAPHCPACGAPVDVPVGVARITCSYCQTSLVVGDETVSTQGLQRRPTTTQTASPVPEPDATLRNWQVGRFEVSLVEQQVSGAVPEIYAGFEVPPGAFAFVSLRAVDANGAPVAAPLDRALAALRSSLENDKDPGLAANLALEALCEGAFSHKLEVAIALFEPERMRVTPYAAGAREALVWASSEEGRCITLSAHGQALERKSLRERGSHFENGQLVHLASNDLVLFPSPGFLGRGARSSGNAVRALLDTANAHLGEAPLRIVTLSKNAFWEDVQKDLARRAPTADVKLVAVRAVLPELQRVSLPGELKTIRTKRFDGAVLVRPGERFELIPLHGERSALIWTGAMSDEQFAAVRAGVLEVLDKKSHGDNDNPRRAGREALERAQVTNTPALVAHLSDQYPRLKWWRVGWKQPVQLGPRGVRGDEHQAFDEGGEATVNEGHRLFFPGTLPVEGEPQKADVLAEGWPGGKASRLFDALVAHWKTKRTNVALEALADAASSDVSTPLEGLALFSGV